MIIGPLESGLDSHSVWKQAIHTKTVIWLLRLAFGFAVSPIMAISSFTLLGRNNTFMTVTINILALMYLVWNPFHYIMYSIHSPAHFLNFPEA